ncbi:MAG: hypothetical protein ACRCZZ_06105 [Phocaeicola sp.]
MYEGLNRKNLIFTESAVNSIIESLPGAPIIGGYNPSARDFEGHNKVLEYDEEMEDFIVKSNTLPYGFVTQEKPQIKNIDGVDYVVAEALLWTKRFPEVVRVLAERNNQSMEIDETTVEILRTYGEASVITFAEVSALCILGEDVTPVFENANFKREGYLDFMLSSLEKGDVQEMPVEENGVVEPALAPVEGEAVAPEVTEPVTEEPVTVEPEAIEPEVVEPVTEEPEVTEDETVEPEVVEPEITDDSEKSEEEGLAIPEEVVAPEIDVELIQFELAQAKEELEALRTFKAATERKEKEAILSYEMFASVSSEFKTSLLAGIDNMTTTEIEGALALEVVRSGFSLVEKTVSEPVLTSVAVPTVSEPAWLVAARRFNK